ncbi:MAG TPA: RtcB family protein [Microscillaceae bacterium]|nr:RtcB family protein [Microscillaceae bacterium]
MKHLKIFGKEIIDDNSINQLKNCLGEEDLGVLTADAHYGYGHPIGGAVAYKDRISLSGVGFDIACGNKAVRTNVLAADLDTAKVMDEIFKQIGFGIGRANREKADHPVLDKIAQADFEPIRDLAQMATDQLGTVGSGNHFVDLFEDEQGYVWIGVHFGSRGFGHKITTGFIAMSQGKAFQERGKEGGMDAKPILFDTTTDLGQAYTYCLGLGGEYAYAGRNWVVNKVLEILQAESTFEVHNHHNFAWEEEHFGEKYWVVRKGCTPAFPGQLGFIGANMYDTSVIIEGVDSAESKEGLYSTVHGAGRVMSRNAAAGKKKWVKGPDGKRRPKIVKPGAVNFAEVQQRMQEKGIELRGGGADEAPQCYKKLEDVIAYQGDTIRVLHKLNPIGVAMAGSEVFDPYKD